MAMVGSRSSPLGKAFIQKGKGKIMVPKLTDNKKEILQSLDRDDLPLPPYWVTRLPSNSPPGPEAALPNPGPAGAPEAALPPAPPEMAELPSWQAPIPAKEPLVNAHRIQPQTNLLKYTHLSW